MYSARLSAPSQLTNDFLNASFTDLDVYLLYDCTQGMLQERRSGSTVLPNEPDWFSSMS